LIVGKMKNNYWIYLRLIIWIVFILFIVIPILAIAAAVYVFILAYFYAVLF